MTGIDVHRVEEGRPDLLDVLVAVRAVTDQELNPGDPPPSAAELAGDLFAGWTRERRQAWVATLDGDPVGELTFRIDDAEENRHRVDAEWLAVVPRARRRGVADALLRAGLDVAGAEGRTSVTFGVPATLDGAGVAYAARLGATKRMEERCSRLRVCDIPWDVVHRWRDEGRTRTDGYRLVQWIGRVPDEHLDLMVAVQRAMEDMPTDELDWSIPTMGEDDVRSFDEAAEARGLVPIATAAVSPTGEPAAFSVLFASRHRPVLGWQGDTGVLAEHRGHGLGRWLKAENLEHALGTEPRIEVVETYNAESNPWMLEINVAMGFRPHVGYEAWQAEVATVRAVLGA
ncbi:MAG TPA: GNAT family N-acetyltransferase [Acidimicrobiales bacterium]|nr:GNAT family N-acetyltransferase [Acidimicrobiales bacterium]